LFTFGNIVSSYFLLKFLTHLVEIAFWKISVIALMVILILFNWTKSKASSHKDVEVYFTISPKILEIFSEILEWRIVWPGLMVLWVSN
jgi:hypothetical protein